MGSMFQLTNSYPFNQILKNNFHILEKSSEDIENCQLFFLGNTHYRQEQQWKISWLIQQLYREGDSVLVESFYEDPRSCSETKFVAKKINLKGWDSKLREKEFEQEKCLINALLHIDHIRKQGLNHKNWIKDIHQLIYLFPPPKEIQDEIINDLYSEEKLAELDSPQARLDCFNDVAFSLAAMWLAYLKEELMTNLMERNSSMIRTIDRHLPQSSRIFIIAGIAHLTLDRCFNPMEDTIDSVNLVHQYCADKNYVILYPNANNDDLQKIKQELKPLSGSLFKYIFQKTDYCTIAKFIIIVPLLCLKIIAIALAVFVSQKAIDYFKLNNSYHESLKKLSISKLIVLISSAADNPTSLPSQTTITPSNKIKTPKFR